MTLRIGRLHPITVYRAGFWVCADLVLSVMCLCHHLVSLGHSELKVKSYFLPRCLKVTKNMTVYMKK